MNRLFSSAQNIYLACSRRRAVSLEERGTLQKKRTLATVYAIFTILTITVLVIFAISPAITTMSKLQAQLSDDKHVQNALEEKLKNLDLLRTEYEVLKPDLPTLLLA